MRAPPESLRPTTGDAELHRQVHDLDDLRGVGFRQRSAEHREVLREGEHLPAVDEPVAGDDAVARDDLVGHPEVEAAVRDELVELLERARIEQQIDPLARRQLAGLVLAAQALFAAAQLGAPLEIGQDVGGIHVGARGSSARGSCLARDQRLRLIDPTTEPPSAYAFTACDFSQSFRNFSRPMLVSGWLKTHRSPPAGTCRCRRPCARLRRCASGGGSWRRGLPS